jgi:hypothetical protein
MHSGHAELFERGDNKGSPIGRIMQATFNQGGVVPRCAAFDQYLLQRLEWCCNRGIKLHSAKL